MNNKLLHATWYIFTLIFTGWFVLISFWLFWPYEPLVIKKNPMPVLNENKTVKAGENLIYQICWDKKMDVTGTLTRKLINDFTIDLRPSVVTNPIGAGTDKVPVLIPLYAVPGKYILSWSAEYKVNPIRTITVYAVSEQFTVTAPDGPKQGIQGKPGTNFWGR
jgi:hypothetical protein